MIKNLIIKWVLAHLADMVNGVDWDGMKAKIHAKIEAAIPYWILEKPLELFVDEVIDAIQTAATDEADLLALIKDCADSNWAAAEADLAAILDKVVNPTPVQVALKAALAA